MEKTATAVILAVVLIGIAAFFCLFTVGQNERAILLRLGEVERSDFSPGLHVKMPLINIVRKFDGRIQTLEAEPERYLTLEKKNVLVDSFVKWRIADVARYYTATGGDEALAGVRLYQIVKAGLRGEFGKRTIQEVVSGDRAQIMDILTVAANQQAQQFGIAVVDVRLRRVDLPKEVSAAVYQRMQAERAKAAKDLRARGFEESEKIRADADRQRVVTLANAYRDAERLRGEGDAQASAVYAKAYGNDPEFFALYRSLNAYKATFGEKSDLLVLQPDSDFFRYFKNPHAPVPGTAVTTQAVPSASAAPAAKVPAPASAAMPVAPASVLPSSRIPVQSMGPKSH